MIYSFSQISQYLPCRRRYRHRYLDGWQEKDVRAGMPFGRALEQALAALFRHEDPIAVLFEQWTNCKNHPLVYPEMTRGIVCSSKLSNYWSALSRMGVFGSASRELNNESSSRGT